MDVPDGQLLTRIVERDQQAFAEFYDRHAPRIYGFLLKIVKNAREAEDLLQETFWKVWSSATIFDPARGEPANWLVVIARSRAQDHLRRESRKSRALDASADAERAADARTDGPADDFARSEASARTREALLRLPDEQRAVIQLAFYGGLTHQQIAERQNLSLGTVKTRIRLGMKKLREILVSQEAMTP